ncbi:sugar phosphate isomerase/epimerase family protein [Pseudovibrio sp. Tun.PSC04-5.I4]|uniref:sugar phosphate isomerase/epimerase family protein n=1 Tax=Pseudovibrio sp. Tun.PSC04-5.I4 TaxID=1798213 RepID=UPI000881C2B3|nr:sugar phosphate isomerase/epimerase family protein [Pseudovibrio sp. Tun.PSC04-5.I4]SDR35706.1 Sugar phosphate isomerase/epimerase [Pseudovibrio sp. Tun.PSC04-5.I4]
MSDLPVLGAAMCVKHLAQHRDWLLELPRDLELQDFHNWSLLDSGCDELIADAKKLLDGHEGRVGIHGPFWNMDLAAGDPLFQEVVRKRLDKGLDACAKMGGDHMVIHSPYTIWDHNNLATYDGARQVKLDMIHANLKGAVAKAEDIGCVMVLENIEDLDPDFRLDIVKSFNSEALAVSIDTGHAHYMHVSHGAPPVDCFIKSAGNALEHLHIQDVDGYADRHWNPGEGAIAWEPVFSALGKLESNPRLIIEVMDETKLRKGADYLVNLGVAR